MKKKVFALCSLVLVLMLSVILAACNFDKKYEVAVDYDNTKGEVIVSDSSEGEPAQKFKAGTQVFVTVSAYYGYEVDTFTVDGENAELSGGSYSFNINADTTVEVTFKYVLEGIPESMRALAAAWESVSTTFKASGSYNFTIEGEDPQIINTTTVFGENAVSLYEIGEDGELDEVLVNLDGKVAIPYHTLDNKLEYDYPNEDVPFDEYGNPFKLLALTDFEATDTQNVYKLTADTKKDGAATAITGYVEKIESFTLTVESGKVNKVTKIEITTQRIKRGSGDNEYYYTSVYTFAISEWGKAEVEYDKINPYQTKTEHTALAQALAAAGNAKNYTVNVFEVEAGEEDVVYDTYVTETAIYYACPGWENGYVQMGEGASTIVYPFNYDPDDELVTLHDAVKGFPTVTSMRATFDGFAPEIFELSKDGKYVLRPEFNTPEYIGYILLNFANGLDEIMLYYNYTYSVSITIKDGALETVELSYYVYGADVVRTLTYSDFDETEMPISFDNCEKESVLDDFVGTYTDGTVTAVIDKNGIKINDTVYEVTNYDVQYGVFTGNWNGGKWYISKQGEKQLLLFNNDTTYVLTSTAIDPVSIPEEFEGVWSDSDNTVAIAYDKVEFNGNMLKVLSYDEDEGLYATDGEYTYLLNVVKSELWVTKYSEGLTAKNYTLTKAEDAVLIPEELVGTFEKEDIYYNEYYKAVIGLTTVTLELNGKNPTVTVVSATHDDGYWQLTLDVDGDEYYLTEGNYSADQIELYSIAARFSVTLDKVAGSEPTQPTVPEIPDKFYGAFSGEDDGVTYVVTISVNGVSIKIGDDEAILITDYEYDDGEISFIVDGVEYGVVSYGYDSLVESLYFYNYDGLYAELTRVAVEIPDEFVGTFEGEDSYNNITVKLIVTKDGVEAYFNGEKKNATVEKVEYNDYYDSYDLYVTIDGIACSLGVYGSSYMLSSVDDWGDTLSALLKKTEGETPEEGDWSKFYGTFTGENSGTVYVITIDENGITLTQDGNELEVRIDDYDDYDGFTVTVNGGVYYIYQYGHDAEITKIVFACSDNSVYVTLDKQ